MHINQSGNFLPIIGILIILIVFSGGVYYLRIQESSYGLQFKDEFPHSPSSAQQLSIPTSGSIIKNSELVEYKSRKLPKNSMKAYSIKYPTDWEKKSERLEELTDKLTLYKKDHLLSIWQGPTGGIGCAFEGEMPEGPYEDYRNTEFTEIKTGFANFRRVKIDSEDKNSRRFIYCASSSSDPTFFGSPTMIGAIFYITPVNYDPLIIKEMDQIVSTLQATD